MHNFYDMGNIHGKYETLLILLHDLISQALYIFNEVDL